MNIDRYIKIRNCYKEFTSNILDTEDDNGIKMRRAGRKLGFVNDENVFVFEDEDETNVLMDFLIYEKNGLSNRIIDRISKDENSDLNDLEEMILEGMRANHFSLFEVVEKDLENNSLELSDLLGSYIYTLKDVGFSSTAQIGTLIATRLVPIEDVYFTSGLSFAFNEDKRLRLLTFIAKNKRKPNRRKSIKIKAKKSNKVTLMEIMFNAHKRWGYDVVTLDPSDI